MTQAVLPEQVRRRNAAQATLDHWRGRPFRMGRVDCARMTAWHLRQLGHPVRLPASGSYASVRSAAKQLAERGYSNLLEVLDGYGFERIAPAAARLGDIVAIPSEHPIGCLTISVGNGRVCGFHEDCAGAEVIQPVEFAAAWRVPII